MKMNKETSPEIPERILGGIFKGIPGVIFLGYRVQYLKKILEEFLEEYLKRFQEEI